MKKIIFLLYFFVSSVWADDAMVLIHGFGGDVRSWHKKHIIRILQNDGWQVAAYGYYDYRYGVYIKNLPVQNPRKIFILNLPYRTPISYQAQVATNMLFRIDRINNHKLHLVSHSVGGVVARFLAVTNQNLNIKSLISIASPHFGTRRTEMALDFTDLPFPMNIMDEAGGGKEYDKFKSAKGLFLDLRRPKPGTFLYWLNWQPHPDINYYSIVRKRKSFFSRDILVPTVSQDMGLLPMLQGRQNHL